MSSKAKKRKVSMEPVLQDFTVTSFSDLHSDVAGPSDSSLFEEIKNFDVELPEITFNQTADINLFSGPYPSDSSLNSFIKPQSTSKTNSKAQRLFQKRQKKKSEEENLFDSCLKDSFSDNSIEKVHKPFQTKKQKNEVRLSIFDSDLESKTPIQDSPFKKPFQRKSKNKQQPNLFDSLINDSQSDTPNQQRPRPFQRKSKMKISSNFLDDILSNDSINQQSPPQNFVTRRKNKIKKINDSKLFDEDLHSSQSDVSMPLQPFRLKHRIASNDTKNDTAMFDDLLDATDNESQNEKSSVLDPCNKNNSNEGSTKSFNLELNEETGSTKCADSLTNEDTREPETDDKEKYQHEKNKNENKFTSELTDQQNTSTGDECLKLQEHVDKDKSVVQSSDKGDSIEYRSAILEFERIRGSEENEGEIESTAELTDKLEHKSEILGHERTRAYEENEGEIESTAELTETIQSETQDKEATTCETEDEDTIQIETEDEDTLQLETEETRRSEEKEEDSESRAELTTQSNFSGDEKSIKKNYSRTNFTDLISFHMNNSKNRDNVLEGNESATDTEANDGTNQYNVGVAKELNLIDSINICAKSRESRRSSLSCTVEHKDNRQESVIEPVREEPSPKLETSLMKLNSRESTICSPDGSFKGVPSSTPNVKGKRVSFVLREESCLRGSKENNGTSTRRKSSLRFHKGNNDSSNVNNLTKDNSIGLRKKRVSFKLDERKNDSLKQSDVKNCDKLEHSKENQSNNYCSSVSLESLVFVEPSGSRTLDSESVYIDIHPSRGKSTSSSNTESFSNCEKKAISEVSISQAKSKSFKTSDSCAKDTEICEYEEINVYKESDHNIECHEVSNLDNDCCVGEQTNNEEEYSDSENAKSTLSRAVCETSESESEEDEPDAEDEESDAEDEESDAEDEESDVGDEESVAEEKESDVEQEESDAEEEGSDAEEVELDSTTKHLSSEQKSEEEQDLIAEDQEAEINSSGSSGNEDLFVNNVVTSPKPDENLNPNTKITGEFKLPFRKRIRTSSLFKEKIFEVPSKSQLKDILNKIPISEFKKRYKRKSSAHGISREQMQQYEIEEELMKNHKKKTHNKETFSASTKLKRPKKWVSPGLYAFLINKLKPQFGIRSRVRAEELVLFLVDHVECIQKKKELLREDVEEFRTELAKLGIIKTYWDLFKFVNHYFENKFIEKMYPSLPGKGQSAFKFGPTNVMENIL